jgi:pentatricopeptide repeat protein
VRLRPTGDPDSATFLVEIRTKIDGVSPRMVEWDALLLTWVRAGHVRMAWAIWKRMQAVGMSGSCDVLCECRAIKVCAQSAIGYLSLDDGRSCGL